MSRLVCATFSSFLRKSDALVGSSAVPMSLVMLGSITRAAALAPPAAAVQGVLFGHLPSLATPAHPGRLFINLAGSLHFLAFM